MWSTIAINLNLWRTEHVQNRRTVQDSLTLTSSLRCHFLEMKQLHLDRPTLVRHKHSFAHKKKISRVSALFAFYADTLRATMSREHEGKQFSLFQFILKNEHNALHTRALAPSSSLLLGVLRISWGAHNTTKHITTQSDYFILFLFFCSRRDEQHVTENALKQKNIIFAIEVPSLRSLISSSMSTAHGTQDRNYTQQPLYIISRCH